MERQAIVEAFRAAFGSPPQVVVRAPGRVNLIGEHTDYNEGYVLPVAIDRYVWFAGTHRHDRLVRARALDFGAEIEFSLDDIQKDSRRPWANYLRGVAAVLQAAGQRLAGADLVYGGDVPREAGLSSSAAVEVAAMVFWQRLLRLPLEAVEIATLSRRAENEFVGVPTGIMDQFASACARRDHALFLDCRDLRYRLVPLRDDVAIVVCNSGVKRALASSEYEVRWRQCRAAVEALNHFGLRAQSLRDVTPAQLREVGSRMDPLLLKRARHVVTENQRVLDAVRSLEQGDLQQFGSLLNASHASLRDDYEVSCRELDVLVELAQQQPSVLGARMTGAGFGGCTVNLVRRECAEEFARVVAEGYQKALHLQAEVYVCQASDGALAGG